MAEAEGSSPIENVCPKCGRSFPTKQGLSMHITSVHVKPMIAAQGRPDPDGTAGREVIWKKNGPTIENLEPGDTSINLGVNPELQRPLDEGKLEEAHAQWAEVGWFVDQTNEYLVKLREQIRFRRSQGLNDVELIDAFFLLYDDVQASI